MTVLGIPNTGADKFSRQKNNSPDRSRLAAHPALAELKARLAPSLHWTRKHLPQLAAVSVTALLWGGIIYGFLSVINRPGPPTVNETAVSQKIVNSAYTSLGVFGRDKWKKWNIIRVNDFSYQAVIGLEPVYYDSQGQMIGTGKDLKAALDEKPYLKAVRGTYPSTTLRLWRERTAKILEKKLGQGVAIQVKFVTVEDTALNYSLASRG